MHARSHALLIYHGHLRFEFPISNRNRHHHLLLSVMEKEALVLFKIGHGIQQPKKSRVWMEWNIPQLLDGVKQPPWLLPFVTIFGQNTTSRFFRLYFLHDEEIILRCHFQPQSCLLKPSFFLLFSINRLRFNNRFFKLVNRYRI